MIYKVINKPMYKMLLYVL